MPELGSWLQRPRVTQVRQLGVSCESAVGRQTHGPSGLGTLKMSDHVRLWRGERGSREGGHTKRNARASERSQSLLAGKPSKEGLGFTPGWLPPLSREQPHQGGVPSRSRGNRFSFGQLSVLGRAKLDPRP